MANGVFEGRCTCGSVRYRMQAPPMIVHCCHCTWCQRETGSSYVINALIETDRLAVLDGEPVEVLTPSASGKGQKIWRCPECHVALWSHFAGFGDKVSFVRVGTLDDEYKFEPDVHVFTTSRRPWVRIPDTHRSFDEFYTLKEEWPDESRSRLRAALTEG